MSRTAYHPMGTAQSPTADSQRTGSLIRAGEMSTRFNSAAESWSKHHQYRTAYRDFCHEGGVPATTFETALDKPEVSDYARNLHSIGVLKSPLTTVQIEAGRSLHPTELHVMDPPANFSHARERIVPVSPMDQAKKRTARMSGLNGFMENLVRYPPLGNARDLTPAVTKTWENKKELRYDVPEQEYTMFDKKEANHKAQFGQFIPQSSTLRPHAFRDFHKDTGLFVDGGKRASSYELPAGYQHYTQTYSQAGQISPVPVATMKVIQGRHQAPFELETL